MNITRHGGRPQNGQITVNCLSKLYYMSNHVDSRLAVAEVQIEEFTTLGIASDASRIL